MPDRKFTTPMMIQYMDIKKDHPDCLLFFRLGDFYELFLEDAEIGAQILGITLTARPRGKDGDIPMAGVPYHSSDSYLTKLVKAGYKVAICEQVSQPDNKGIVDRKVTRIVTPGTITNESSLDHKKHNYLLTISSDKDTTGLTFTELTTAEIYTTQFPNSHLTTRLPAELTRFQPSEIIHNPDISKSTLKIISAHSNATQFPLPQWSDYQKQPLKHLKKYFSPNTLKQNHLTSKNQSTLSTAIALRYLSHTQQQLLPHLTTLQSFDQLDSLILDASTQKNLEIFESLKDSSTQNTLISTLDQTQTPLGARLLRHWLKHPLLDKKQIISRQSAIQYFIDHPNFNQQTTKTLKHITDLQRLISKLNLNLGTPKDLIRLAASLNATTSLKQTLKSTKNPLLKSQHQNISSKLNHLTNLINQTLKDSVPTDPKKGNFIKPGIDKQLDSLRHTIKKSQDWIAKSQEQQRQATGINSLKIKFNKVFGYYIEVSQSNLDQVPSHYIRKQTLVNAERFITPDLKHHEDIILSNQTKTLKLELQIFSDLINQITQHTSLIQQASQAIATTDALLSLAQVAQTNHYTCPKINTKGTISLSESRHPIVETTIEKHNFVPNDTILGKDHQLLIITGPNMAGKSVFMRQVALITLLSHIGSFVPADKANVCLVDRIFVRSGASDFISQGLSTFMVEMVETANILNLATPNSLIIMDEIGRGTTTYDGISIAWAIAEHLITQTKAKTLFATHYHELQTLEDKYPNLIKNYHAAVEEHQNQPVFLHRIIKGKAAHSYGIAVAKLAGVPNQVANNAKKILKTLESSHNLKPQTPDQQLTLNSATPLPKDSHIISQLQSFDLLNTTPLQALTFLAKLKEEIE